MSERKHRILVVEDQPEIRQILDFSLSRGGYDVEVAFSAPQGLRKIENSHFDLILTDLSMPGMDGTELIEQVRANPEKKHIPIVAVTAHNWGTIAQEAVRVGCDGFILKPVVGKQLLREVEKYLRGWRGEEHLNESR